MGVGKDAIDMLMQAIDTILDQKAEIHELNAEVAALKAERSLSAERDHWLDERRVLHARLKELGWTPEVKDDA